MEDSLEKNNGLRDSGEVPVDIEIEIQGETNGNQTNKESIDANCINVEGSVSGNETGHSATNVEKPVEKLESGTSQPVKAGRQIQNQNRALRLLAAKLFDDRVPLRKKAGVNDKLVYMFPVVSVSDLPRDRVEKPHIVEIFSIFIRLATVQDDGTVQFEVPGDIKPEKLDFGTGVVYNGASGEAANDVADIPVVPPLQIVMLIVGTRGDVQPFVAIGKKLQENGHRVRLATHANFKEFVLGAGLEFYPLGGDPKVLAAYMVKNKGFLPSGPSEILIQRNQIKDIVFSLLPACVDPDPETNVPFKVNAIIANPPAYGHTHVAEALQVPLHLFFTMPWTPTSEFPHPLSRVKQSVANRLSYQVVDGLIWLGIRDVINDFRKKKLMLRRLTYLSNSNSFHSDVPFGYIWSPHLVPKPKDWGPKIDVVGFCFLDLASNYEPPESLVKWLEDGEKPIYIGFGSLPVQEPEKMTEIIVQALEITGQRGIINKGWGGLGSLKEPKDFVYLLDNCPHDWLFLQCAAVVHHGGAGTTAAGLKAACPTTVVPFFGDQQFWGERVHSRGVGPAPIPVDEFSLEKLVAAIRFMLDPKVKECAVELAKAMEHEDGVTGAVKAFYKHFPLESLEPKPEVLPRSPHFFSLRRCLGHS